MATVKVLTTRQLNRALLARQMLLERSTAPIPRVLERMGGFRPNTPRRSMSACGRGWRASSEHG